MTNETLPLYLHHVRAGVGNLEVYARDVLEVEDSWICIIVELVHVGS